jgi:predicted metal-binding membrane protein
MAAYERAGVPHQHVVGREYVSRTPTRDRGGGLNVHGRAPPDASLMAASEAAHGGIMMPGMPIESALSPEMPMALALGLGLFMAMWVGMMIAMMFPSVYPMVLLLARISRGPAGPSA